MKLKISGSTSGERFSLLVKTKITIPVGPYGISIDTQQKTKLFYILYARPMTILKLHKTCQLSIPRCIGDFDIPRWHTEAFESLHQEITKKKQCNQSSWHFRPKDSRYTEIIISNISGRHWKSKCRLQYISGSLEYFDLKLTARSYIWMRSAGVWNWFLVLCWLTAKKPMWYIIALKLSDIFKDRELTFFL